MTKRISSMRVFLVATLVRHKHIVLFLTLLFYVSLIYIFNKSLIFGVIASFTVTGITFWVTNDLFFSLFSVFFVTLPLAVPSKDYQFIYADVKEYKYISMPTGIIDSIYITISNIWGVFLILYFLNRFVHALIKRSNPLYFEVFSLFRQPITAIILLSWISYFALSTISASQFSVYSGYSLNYVFHEFNIVTVFICTLILTWKERKKSRYFVYPVLSLLTFMDLLGLSQAFLLSNKSVLGLYQNPDSEQNHLIARVWGIIDPNDHGYIVAILLLLVIPFIKQVKPKLMIRIILALSVLNIILSQSRVVWFAVAVISVAYFMMEGKNKILHLIRAYSRAVIFFATILGILLITIIFPRLASLQLFFNDDGGGTLRKQMITEGLHMLARSPWFGFGAGMNVRTLLTGYRFGSGGYVRSFPFPIHFAYLQIALDAGVPAAIDFFVPYLVVLRYWIILFKKLRHNVFFLSGFGCIIMTLIYYAFQPVFGRTVAGFTGVYLGLCVSSIIYAKQETYEP